MIGANATTSGLRLTFNRPKIFKQMKFNVLLITLLTLIVGAADSHGNQSSATIPLHDNGRSTLYVNGKFGDLDDTELMVDTGSGYVTINEDTLKKLQDKGLASYVKQVKGILANGSLFTVPIWKVSSLTINNNCVINDIEAAVFPGNTRQILGLSALRKAAPFTISLRPSSLTLTGCNKLLSTK